MFQREIPEPSGDDGIPATSTKLDRTKALLTETKRITKQLKRENKRLKMMLESNGNPKEMDMEKENSDLKKLLKETKVANKRLKQQNKRQKQVWFALQQMCQALEGFPKSDKSPPQTKHKKSNIQLISMSSKLKRFPSGDKYNVSVKYTAKRKPGVYWAIKTHYRNGVGGQYTTSGWTESTQSNKTYVSGVELNHNLLVSHAIALKIYDAPDFVVLDWNMAEMLKDQTNDFENLLIEVHGNENPIIASAKTNMTVSFQVQGNISDVSIDAYMGGLNYTRQPPEKFEISSFMGDDILVEAHKISNTSTNVSITVHPYVSENGGTLSLAATFEPPGPRLYTNIQYGKSIEVLSRITKTAVRPGAIGLFPMDNITFVYPPFDSVACYAMGFEKPDVVLVRQTDDGPQEMRHDAFVEPDKYTVIKMFTVNATDLETEGNYKCIASTKKNDVSVSSQTEVVRIEPPVIIETDTGVITNTSDLVKVMCSAAGNPEPYLELRLYDEDGSDLCSQGLFKVNISNPDPKTTVLVVTISPVIRDIYKVQCVALAEGFEDYKDIEIFPEPESGPNWNLVYDMDNELFKYNKTLI